MMSKVSALERTSLLLGLLCLWTGSAEAAALHMYQFPPCVSAVVRAEPIMECRFPPMEENGIAFILWYRGNERLLRSDKHFKQSVNFSTGSGSLQISRVQTDDAGVYVCEVGNSNYTLKGNGTKLEVHGSGQKPENQAAADGCISVTVPHEEEAPMALIVGLTFLLLILSLLIVCCFKVRKWFPAKESLRSRADTHTETPTQQETAEVRTQLYSNPESTTGVTKPEERHLQCQAPAIPVKDSSLNYSSVCFRKEYLEPAQRNEEPTTLYAPVKKKKSPASDAVYDQP